MAAQRLFEPPQRPRPTIAERTSEQPIALEPRGSLIRGTAFALGLSVTGFWAPLTIAISLLV
jgi:hypothetical protein